MNSKSANTESVKKPANVHLGRNEIHCCAYGAKTIFAMPIDLKYFVSEIERFNSYHQSCLDKKPKLSL